VSRWSPESLAAAVDAILHQAPVMPVLSISRAEDALPLAHALIEGGLPVLEITLRSAAALEAIRLVRTGIPQAIVGAGTVLTPVQLKQVAEAGAMFAISPGATVDLYAAAAVATIPLLPGIATASELMQGLCRGYERFKFFPAAAAGGLSALRAFAGPFPHVKFCPTGGIDRASASDYLALANVITVGGSWMAPADAVRAADWPRITLLARDCANLEVTAGAR
jgi:2-dehydro-3-deoxyphosphogluconate aldolase / (4S)-4-hydroxy-2-oxoglutarate aldolase